MENLMTQVPYEHFMAMFVTGGRDVNLEDFKDGYDFSELRELLSAGSQSVEDEMCHVTACVVNRVLGALTSEVDGQAQRFVFKNTSGPTEGSICHRRASGSIFPDTDLVREAWINNDAICEAKQEPRQSYTSQVEYNFAEVPFEIKATEDRSAFHINNQQFIRSSAKKGEMALKETALRASEILLHQHRIFLFMVYITGFHAHLIRWDRMGAVVSEDINLLSNAKDFLTFICRIFTMSPEQRGHDPTARHATQAQIKALQSYQPANKDAQDMVQDILDNQRLYPIYQVDCPVIGTASQQEAGSKTFLIGKYHSGRHSPTGRATRGYVAYDVSEDRLAFLKDSWRPDLPGLHPEAETYARLRRHNVQFVATAIAGGDVGYPNVQVTHNQEFIQGSVRRIHHRVIVREVGKLLDTYENSFDMIEAVFQALQGHSQAWERARILHCDISNGNILINTDGPDDELHAFLNDWDICQYEEDFSKEATQNGCSGTWPFLSALLLQYPRKPHEVADDLESFVHVITWMAFRFHEHDDTKIECTVKQASTAEIMAANEGNPVLSFKKYCFFDQEAIVNGFATGGYTKRDVIKAGKPPVSLRSTIEGQTPLASLLNTLYSLLHQHYRAVDFDALSPYKIPGLSSESKTGPSAPRVKRTKRTITNPSSSNRYDNSAEPITTPVQRKSERVLDAHAHVLGAFFEVGKLMENATDSLDKTADQFLSLPWFGVLGDSRTSSESVTSASVRQSSLSGSVRKSDNGVGISLPSAASAIAAVLPVPGFSAAPEATRDGNSAQSPRSNTSDSAGISSSNQGSVQAALSGCDHSQTTAAIDASSPATADVSPGDGEHLPRLGSPPLRRSQRIEGRSDTHFTLSRSNACRSVCSHPLRSGPRIHGSSTRVGTRGGASSSQNSLPGPKSQDQGCGKRKDPSGDRDTNSSKLKRRRRR